MRTYQYECMIQEWHLDTFGHVNNATYLTILEQARWEILNEHGWGIDTIKKTGIGPVILRVEMDYKQELKARDQITIETKFVQEKAKLFHIEQSIKKENGNLSAEAKYLAAIWDVKERKIISPPEEWAKIITT